jgi:hypothetical protein
MADTINQQPELPRVCNFIIGRQGWRDVMEKASADAIRHGARRSDDSTADRTGKLTVEVQRIFSRREQCDCGEMRAGGWHENGYRL